MCTFAVFNTIFHSDQITLIVSQSLPMLQENETYFCHFAGDEATFTVPAVVSGATYMCNITGSLPAEYGGLTTGSWAILLIVNFVESFFLSLCNCFQFLMSVLSVQCKVYLSVQM